MVFYNRKGVRTFFGRVVYDRDGNLRAVPVGIMVVALAIAVMAIVVQVKKPTEQAVVKVTHLFKATPQENAPESPPPEPEAQRPEPDKKQTQSESPPAAVEPPNEQADTAEPADQQYAPPPEQEETEKQPPAQGEPADSSELNQARERIDALKTEVAHLKEKAAEELAQARRIQEAAAREKEALREELSRRDAAARDAADQIAAREAALEQAEQENAGQQQQLQQAETALEHSEARLQVMQAETAAPPAAVLAQAGTVRQQGIVARDEAETFRKSAVQVKQRSEQVRQSVASVSKQPSPAAPTPERVEAVRVATPDYAAMYRDRFEAGKSEPGVLYRWRVANRYRLNLSTCYRLFDMKAVALTRDGRYFDLDDASLLTEDYLSQRFSGTVIVCERPDSDFPDQLERLRLDPGSVTVRYYMYPRIRNYFYARVEQAVRCCLGASGGSADPESIDVVGAVFKIEKEGGRFGVFVPTAVYVRSGAGEPRHIEVSPGCFDGAPDVAMLRKKGLL